MKGNEDTKTTIDAAREAASLVTSEPMISEIRRRIEGERARVAAGEKALAEIESEPRPPYTDAEVEELVVWANEVDDAEWTPAMMRRALDEKKETVRAAQKLMRRAEARGYARAYAAQDASLREANRESCGACPCGGPNCEGPADSLLHQCGGSREACGVPGCKECGSGSKHPTSDIAAWTCTACGAESSPLLSTGAAGSTSLCIDCYHTAAEDALEQHALDRAAFEEALAQRDGDVAHLRAEVERLRNPNLLRNLEQWDILPGGTYEPAFVDRMHAISAALGEAQRMKGEFAAALATIERLTEERDEAVASLSGARNEAPQSVREIWELRGGVEAVRELTARAERAAEYLDEARATIERMKPVVDAALRWRKKSGVSVTSSPDLMDAVDVLILQGGAS